jgi:hypothetical protein
MSTFLLFISGLLLGIIAWQDFRDRAVSAWVLGLLTVTELLKGYVRSTTGYLLWQFIQNVTIIFSLLTIVWIYLIVKNRKWMNLFNKGFGSADLILLLILGINLSPTIFVVFMLTGFILALSITLVFQQFSTSCEQTIPLAGYLAVWAIFIMILSIAFPQYPPDDDGWLMLILNVIQ